MFWIICLVGISFLSLLIFSQRYSDRTIKQFPLTQFFYLFISAPIISVCLINLALTVMHRPGQSLEIIPDQVLFSLYCFAVILGTLGAGIHSLSVTISNSLLLHERLKAFRISESVHGFLSHEMLYISCMVAAFLLILIEQNHPLAQSVDFMVSIGAGLIIGLVLGLSMVLAMYIRVNLLLGIPLVIFTLGFLGLSSSQLANFPYSIMAATALLFSYIILMIALVVFEFFRSFTIFCVKHIFPTGHRLRIELNCN